MKIRLRPLVWISALILGASCAITPLPAQEGQDKPRPSSPAARREARRPRKPPSPAAPPSPSIEPSSAATGAVSVGSGETPKKPDGAAAAPSKPERKEGEPAPTGGPEADADKTAAQAPEEELVSLDLDNVEIKYVIKLISDLTGKDYILSDQVRGTVTVMSPTKIPVDELPKVLESLLEVRNLATVPSGNFIKIMPRRDAIRSPVEFESAEGVMDRSPEDTLVTQIIPLQYADLNEVQRLISTLCGRDSSVITYPPTNTLIISDTVSNLDRLMKIIKEVDIPGLESTITVVPCQYAAASLLAEEVLSIVSQKGGGAAKPAASRRRGGKTPAQPAAAGGEDSIKLFADERTNALIIVASPDDTERVLALVEELDRQTPESKTRVRVKRLSYSNSDDVASVLSSLTAARTGEGMPPITVSSYPEINALVIDASPQDYDLLTRIIEDLDIPRDQVMVEVIITEVDLSKSLSLEVQMQSLKGINYTPGDNAPVAQYWQGTEFDPSLRTMLLDQIKNKTNYPLSAGTGFNYGYIWVPESDKNAIGPLSVLLNALEADTDINVLAAPQVLTCDNEEVSFSVVDRVPILTSTLTTGSGTTGTDTIQQIDYRDVGTKIKLIPHISKDRFVRLEVDQSVEQLVGVSLSDISGPLTPATLKRETATVVTVKDGHTVVISGMISDSYTTQESKVPIFGDIPVLGLLARYRKNSVGKVNLIVFITPRIVRNPTELALVTQKTRDRGAEFLEEAHSRPPRMIDRFTGESSDESVKKLPPEGEAKKPYGIKK